MSKRTPNQWFRIAHKWAGLVAAAWLIVLGATGVLLDHPDWRPLNQITVPQSWGSASLTRLIRVTLMREVLVDPADASRWYGASERGLWHSHDGAATWSAVTFTGLDYSPQTYAVERHPAAGFAGALVATDDGLWTFAARDRVERYLLEGERVTSLSQGPAAGVLVGVVDDSRVFFLDTGSDAISWAEMQPIEPVIAGDVSLHRYLMDIHFGHGLTEGVAAILINDYAGIAMVVLGMTGLSYWFLRRRWRRNPVRSTPQRKRTITAWLYRSHAPIIGILAVFPVFYASVTAIPLNHLRPLYEQLSSTTVPAALVPAGFSMRSLAGDVQDVVVNPTDRAELLIATRKGLYRSADGGATWILDPRIPIVKADFGNSLSLFRVDETLFLGAGLDASYYSQNGGETWVPLEGPFTGISSGAYAGGEWHLRNSQAVFSGQLEAELAQSAVKPPPLTGMPLFLFLADIHTGLVIASWFPWVNDLVSLLAIVLVVSGPVIWWRRKWI